MFFEASTRTTCSFEAAMQRLGGTVCKINPSDASLKKGESLEGKNSVSASNFMGNSKLVSIIKGR